jgi:hypothetical protein
MRLDRPESGVDRTGLVSLRNADGQRNLPLLLLKFLISSSGIAKYDQRSMQFVDSACTVVQKVIS